MTYLPGALQVPLSLLITGAVIPAAAGPSSSDGGAVEPPSKRAHARFFLRVFTQYMLSSVACHSRFQHFKSQAL
jgi:hypothetical protein